MVKNLPPSTGDERDLAPIPGSRRLPQGGHGNPLQYSCLKTLMDKIAWQAIVHGVAKNQTQLKRLSTPTRMSLTGKTRNDMGQLQGDTVHLDTVIRISHLCEVREA